MLVEIWDAVVAKLRTAWGLAGSLLMFITPLASLAFRGRVPPEISAALPYVVLFSVAFLLFLVWLASYTWQTAFAANTHVHVPEVDTLYFGAFPYAADSHLRALSAFAHRIFDGDTMRADVVQHAVATNSAIGMRLTDQAERDIGFFDVFSLRKEALQMWLDGRLSEPELKQSDFEPIPADRYHDGPLELIVGAIYIEPKVARAEPSLVFQLADLAQMLLWKRCRGWDEIRIYTSIFSGQGERLAALYGFSKSIYKEHRTGSGANHDVWVRTLRSSDPARLIRGLGGRHNVVVETRNL